MKLYAVGTATGDRLLRYRLKVDLAPHEHRADALVRAIAADGVVRGRRFLLEQVRRGDDGWTRIKGEAILAKNTRPPTELVECLEECHIVAAGAKAHRS